MDSFFFLSVKIRNTLQSIILLDAKIVPNVAMEAL